MEARISTYVKDMLRFIRKISFFRSLIRYPEKTQLNTIHSNYSLSICGIISLTISTFISEFLHPYN